jgi:STE24 endopeptidase
MPDAARSTPGLYASVACLALAFIALFVLNTFVDSPASQQRAAEYFSAEDIRRGLQFSYERKLLGWCGTGLQLALLTAIVCTPWGRRLTDRFDRWTGRRWLLTLLLVGAAYLLLSELLSLPVGLARLEQARAWNMTTQPVSAWLVDWGKSLLLQAVQGSILVLGLYGLMYFFPHWWWLLAGAGGAVLGILYAFLLPELIQPLFNTFTPLKDPYLNALVRTLAKRADVPVDEVLVMDASSRGRHTNAYFVGFGSTRRVVLYDTLLRSHSGVDPTSTARLIGLLGPGIACGPLLTTSEILAARTEGNDEMETILAHEMGHWRHQHIVKGIALGAVAGLIGLFLLSRILRWAVGRRPFCLTGPTDPAGLPLILLLVTLASWLTMPVENGISRSFERQADQDSLLLADKPAAFIQAEKRLAQDNLSNVAPSAFNVWMFSTHPPAVERIEMAKQAAEEHKKNHAK